MAASFLLFNPFPTSRIIMRVSARFSVPSVLLFSSLPGLRASRVNPVVALTFD